VLSNISREIKGHWMDLIITEGALLTKKLLEIDPTTSYSIDSIISGVDLFALLAKNKVEFRKSYGGIVLPLIKDLLIKYKDERNLVISCTRALTEFFKCSDIFVVEKLDLMSQLLNRLENEKDTTLAFFIITALNSLFWKKIVNGKDSFSRYVTIMVDRLKKEFRRKRILPLGSYTWKYCPG